MKPTLWDFPQKATNGNYSLSKFHQKATDGNYSMSNARYSLSKFRQAAINCSGIIVIYNEWPAW